MKYDDEYNSYKFSTNEIGAIINSLYFYHQHSPVLDDTGRDYIFSIVQSLEKTKDVSAQQPS